MDKNEDGWASAEDQVRFWHPVKVTMSDMMERFYVFVMEERSARKIGNENDARWLSWSTIQLKRRVSSVLVDIQLEFA